MKRTPISPLKNILIRKLAVDLIIPEKIIEAVVSHQFSTILEAFKTKNSVEMSGFGRFTFNTKKALKQKEKFLSQKKEFEEQLLQELTATLRIKKQMKLKTAEDNLKAVNIHLHD